MTPHTVISGTGADSGYPRKETVTALSFLEKEKGWQREARFVLKEFDALTGKIEHLLQPARPSGRQLENAEKLTGPCCHCPADAAALTDPFQLHTYGGDVWNSNTRARVGDPHISNTGN